MSKIDVVPRTRPCLITNKETDEIEAAIFHMWFLAPDGWPVALVELPEGKVIGVGYRRIQFVQEQDEHDTFEFLKDVLNRNEVRSS